MYDDDQLVPARFQLARQVKLGRVVCALGIADEEAVDIQIHAAGHAQKRDDAALVGIGNVHKAAVDAHEVVFLAGVLPPWADARITPQPRKDPAYLVGGGNDRRLVGKLIADVDIERAVIPAKLPAGRHIQLVKLHGVGIKDGGQFGGAGVKFEIPFAVQALHLRRCVALLLRRHSVCGGADRVGDKVAACGQLVDRERGKIAVVRCAQLVLHCVSPFSVWQWRPARQTWQSRTNSLYIVYHGARGCAHFFPRMYGFIS